VNVPAQPPRGIRLARLGHRVYMDKIVEQADPRGRSHYWIGGGDARWDSLEGTDMGAVHEGYVSLTPLHLDLTNHRALTQLDDWSLALSAQLKGDSARPPRPGARRGVDEEAAERVVERSARRVRIGPRAHGRGAARAPRGHRRARARGDAARAASSLRRGALRDRAYGDHPLPIGEEQTISQPYIVGFMSQLLELTGQEKVLEVGTGSGYQTAVLAELARRVCSVEASAAAGRARPRAPREARLRQCLGTGRQRHPRLA
jgi:hypothetical protein